MADETGNDGWSKHGTDDIVTRLRAFVSSEHFNPGDRDRIEAADEIERLRAAGDQLALDWRNLTKLDGAHDRGIRLWEEARRG